MTPAAAAILNGMPEPGDLRRLGAGGETLIFAGSLLLFRYRDGDAGARNVAVAVLRQLGYGGRGVAAAMGLTENYVATLHRRALREGTGGLVRPLGRPGKAGPDAWERARRWRAGGVRDAEIARRLGVNQSTVLRHLGPASVQDELPEQPAPGQDAGTLPAPDPEPVPDPEPEPAPAPDGGPGHGGPGHGGQRRPAGGGSEVFSPVCGRDAAACLR